MIEEEVIKKTTSGNIRKYADNILPMARIKKIMKMDPNITDNITIEANYVVCAATELFIKYIAKEVFEMDNKCLSYQNLSQFIRDEAKLDFLQDIVPKKITFREYKKRMAQEVQKKVDDSSGSDFTSDSSSDEEESEDQDNELEEEDAAKK